MLSPRLGLFIAFSIAAACGGKIDDGTDSGVDSGTDSPSPPPACKPVGGSCKVASDCCDSTCVGGVCTAAPPCTPDYVTCSTSSECCSQICDPTGYCAPSSPPPPPPPCEPDGVPCGSPSQCCSQVCNGGGTCGAPPPPCEPYGAPCGSFSQCCSQVCSGGQCAPTSSCQGNGAPCASASDCCSNVCSNSLCGGIALDGGPLCGTTSNKLCDQCVAQNCCIPQICCLNMASCGVNDSVCSQWLACVQSCEQKGHSAFWCTQNACGAPSTSEESALYTCAQQFCSTQCTKD